MKPAIGRIVHFIENTPQARHLAAIVTGISAPMKPPFFTPNRVDLCVVGQSGMAFELNVKEDQSAREPDSWHWPEREAAS